MRTFRALVFGALALMVATAAWIGSTGPAAAQTAQQQLVRARMTVTQSGNTATFVILVQNDSPDTLGILDIRAKVPEGATFQSSWAGVGPAFNPGQYTGGDRAIGWINLNAPARQAAGPFVFSVDTGGRQICSYVYLVVASGQYSGSHVTDPICTQ